MIEKDVTNIDKYGNQSVVTISCRIKFIDIVRFMASSLSNLVDNPAEGIQKIKCKDCSAKNNLIKYKCLSRFFKQAWWKIKKAIYQHI